MIDIFLVLCCEAFYLLSVVMDQVFFGSLVD